MGEVFPFTLSGLVGCLRTLGGLSLETENSACSCTAYSRAIIRSKIAFSSLENREHEHHPSLVNLTSSGPSSRNSSFSTTSLVLSVVHIILRSALEGLATTELFRGVLQFGE